MRKARQAADDVRFERELRVRERRHTGTGDRRLQRILIARQDDDVKGERALFIEALRKRQNRKSSIRMHGSRDLALLAPGRAEADVDDEEDADIEAEGDLRFEIGATTAGQSGIIAR